MQVPMLHHDPTYVEIYQCMWKLKPNNNKFSQTENRQQQEQQKNNRGQTNPYMSNCLGSHHKQTNKQKTTKLPS